MKTKPSTIGKLNTRKAQTMSDFNLEVDTEKFNVVRRKLSFDCNQDLSNEEVVNILIDNAYKNSKPKQRVRVNRDIIVQEAENGLSVRQIAEKYDVSWSTIFRAKKLGKQSSKQKTLFIEGFLLTPTKT